MALAEQVFVVLLLQRLGFAVTEAYVVSNDMEAHVEPELQALAKAVVMSDEDGAGRLPVPEAVAASVFI